jgi:hypothetical protein
LVKNFRGWALSDIVLEQMETGKPYPIKGMWIQTNNFLACAAGEPRRHYEAIRKLDFNVVVDLFMTPTAQAVADIVLPAGTFPEKDSADHQNIQGDTGYCASGMQYPLRFLESFEPLRLISRDNLKGSKSSKVLKRAVRWPLAVFPNAERLKSQCKEGKLQRVDGILYLGSPSVESSRFPGAASNLGVVGIVQIDSQNLSPPSVHRWTPFPDFSL